jgi:hypothetical protein
MAVTYRGPVEELQGTEWSVPDAVLKAGQAAKWIESQHRQAVAEEAARAEADQRQRELLAARLEQQRQAAAAEQEALAQEQGQAAADGQFRVELTELSQAVMTAGAAIVGKGELIEAQTREWEGRHEALVANSEQVVAEAKAQVEFSNATTQVDHEQINAELDAAQQRISSLESELRTVVMTLTGPQGDRGERGLAGSGVGYVDADPRKLEQGSLGKRIFGRAVVPGDLLLQRTPDALKVWRTPDGKGWQQVDQIVNAQELVSQQLAVTDRSTQVTSLQTVSGSGGAGGGGGEHLLVNRIALGAAIAVADSSNWAGVSDVTSGQIVAELTALDGSLRGRTYLVLIPFTWSPAGDQFTVDGELGGLTGLYDINVSVQRSPAVAPAVFTGAMPPGSNRTVVFLSVVPSPGGGGDTTSFRLGGDIEWAHIAQGAAVSVQTGGLQPLWIWS